MATSVLSKWERHARIGLWGVAAVLLVALLLLAAFGFRSHGATPRSKVAAYITAVNKVEIASRPQILRIQSVYTRFSKNRGPALLQEVELGTAQDQLRVLRSRVAALEPPAEAEKLHRLLLQLFDAQIAFAGDVTALAHYLPLLARLQAPLSKENLALRDRVRAATSPATQAQAFHDYAVRARELSDTVARVRTPTLFTALRNAETRHMRDLSRQALRIEAALDGKDSARATTLFSGLVRIAGEPTVAVAQRNTVLAYNRRLRAVSGVAAAVSRERSRLDRSLG